VAFVEDEGKGLVVSALWRGIVRGMVTLESGGRESGRLAGRGSGRRCGCGKVAGGGTGANEG
jgi:hypothetical protein